jgi:PAS domain S-box-containing protein
MSKQKILVVDGGTGNALARAGVLEETGAQIIETKSGDDVLAASATHDLAVAVVDVNTRESGTDIAELLRSETRTRSIPIIFLSSTYSEDFHLFRGYEAGPVDFISKPCHPLVLRNKVNTFLQLDRQNKDLLGHALLKSSKCYYEAILMSMGDPVIIVSLEGTIKDVNKRTLSLLGYADVNELLGAPVRRCLEPAGNTVHLLSDFRMKASSQMQDFQNIEVLLRTRNDGRIPALLSGSVLRDNQGKALGTVLLVRDITERKRMEEQLNAYMLRLEQSNRQLQEFAAVASHDLQEPLRKIKAFGDLLISKYRKDLNIEAADFLERMRNAAERMQTLMESLLTYSRITTKAEPFTRVDLNQVVRNVLTDLEWRVKQTGAEIKVKDLGSIEAEPNQMHQLFQNLLGNALKFHGDHKPVVKVYCRPHLAPSKNKKEVESGFCRICVEDNGIGFDEKHIDRLFAPFQRLHGRHEYEGTGMGLAICNRIVERHSGSIKAWSTPGKGATFMVTLPIRQREEPPGQPTTGSQLSLYGEKGQSRKQ